MVAVNSLEIQRALKHECLEGVKSILEKLHRNLWPLSMIMVSFTGGGALIDGLDRVITRSIESRHTL